MSDKAKHAYLLILVTLLILLSASRTTTEKMRGLTASFMAPSWESLTSLRFFFQAPFSFFSEEHYPTKHGVVLTSHEEISRLQLENRMLRNELNELQEILQKDRISGAKVSENEIDTHLLIDKHHRELQQLSRMQLEAIPARVIFRSRLSWNSSLWINVGESQNETLGRIAIAKNSPVVVGTSIVGVVDYVGRNQSRVRLITDSGLTPAVRAVRGALQNRPIVQQMEALLERMSKRQDLFSSNDDKAFIAKLIAYKETLSKNKESWFLAKGELHGSSKPLWRKQSQGLRGIGFNYDFADEEGPARELRTGKPIDESKKVPTIPILKINDVLITNGMDGVFPPGLQVAIVTKINPLKEGDYFYELEAKPTAGNLDELSTVFVMPPVGYNSQEQAPLVSNG